MGKKKNNIGSSISSNVSSVNELISGERKGFFEQGYNSVGAIKRDLIITDFIQKKKF